MPRYASPGSDPPSTDSPVGSPVQGASSSFTTRSADAVSTDASVIRRWSSAVTSGRISKLATEIGARLPVHHDRVGLGRVQLHGQLCIHERERVQARAQQVRQVPEHQRVLQRTCGARLQQPRAVEQLAAVAPSAVTRPGYGRTTPDGRVEQRPVRGQPFQRQRPGHRDRVQQRCRVVHRERRPGGRERVRGHQRQAFARGQVSVARTGPSPGRPSAPGRACPIEPSVRTGGSSPSFERPDQSQRELRPNARRAVGVRVEQPQHRAPHQVGRRHRPLCHAVGPQHRAGVRGRGLRHLHALEHPDRRGRAVDRVRPPPAPAPRPRASAASGPSPPARARPPRRRAPPRTSASRSRPAPSMITVMRDSLTGPRDTEMSGCPAGCNGACRSPPYAARRTPPETLRAHRPLPLPSVPAWARSRTTAASPSASGHPTPRPSRSTAPSTAGGRGGIPMAPDGPGHWSVDVAGRIGRATSTGSWSAAPEQERSRIDPRARRLTTSRGQRRGHRPWRPSTGATGEFHPPPGTTWSSTSSTWAPSATACTAARARSRASGAGCRYLRDLGVGAIQLMPPYEFAGDRSWGYNPAFPYAVESSYGYRRRPQGARQGRPRAGHRGHPGRRLQPPWPVRPGPVAVRWLVGARQGRHLLLRGRPVEHAVGRHPPGLRPPGGARVPARQRHAVAGRVPHRRPALGRHRAHLVHHRRRPRCARTRSPTAGR